jgi:putative secretion ATPase (PEP-CTERM system associated)
MYTSFYSLAARPFQLSPNHRFFFGSKGHRRAMAYLTYGLHQAEGFIVITGDIGTGKTTLVDYLTAQLAAGRFIPGRVSAGQIEPGAVLAMVAKAFELPVADVPAAELQKRIEGFLLAREKARKRPLLIVDEAQNWPLPALEELRVLSNLQRQGKALLQILLVGQPQFRDALAQPEFEQLRQRVVASHHLDPLDKGEVKAYIEHRLRQVGWQSDPTFEDQAFETIFEYTGGVPRRINLVCSRLLVLSALEERHAVNATAVEEVLAELDQEGGPYEPLPTELQPNANGQVASQASNDNGPSMRWTDIEHWRKEVVRLIRKLERTYGDLDGERRKAECIRAEADQLREQLRRIEARNKTEDEGTRRVVAKDAMAKNTLFRRFVGS